MSFADFDILSQQSNSIEPVGNALINSSLASPLTASGVYCRQHVHAHASANNNASVMETLLKASVDGGVFVDTNNAYSLSFRATVRVFPVTAPVGNYNAYIGVAAYIPTLTAGQYSGGYELVLQITTGGVRLAIRAGQLIGNSDAGIRQPDFQNHRLTCVGSYAANTWYRIRFDIIPVSLTQKRLDAYTSPLGGDDWTLVGSVLAASTDPFWRSTGRSGIVSLFAKEFGGSTEHYVDDFSAYVSVG